MAGIQGLGQTNISALGLKVYTDVLVSTVFSLILGTMGLLSLGYVVLGGINMVLSSGEPDKVKKSKETIIYAIVGLIVVLLVSYFVNIIFLKLTGRTMIAVIQLCLLNNTCITTSGTPGYRPY